MIKRFVLVLPATMMIVACAGWGTQSAGHVAVVQAGVQITGSPADARAILAARDTLNRALVERDARPFAHFWMDDVIITGGNGGSRIGRDSSVRSFAKSFGDSSFVSGLRTPERIDVGAASNGTGQAAESGHWVWRIRDVAGVTEAQGRYLIFWRHAPDGWRIHSELYVTTACTSGPGCNPPK